jgi:Uma2 family endonuclease
MDTLTKKITYAEFIEMDFPDDDHNHYELLDGELVIRNTPAIQHQRISRNLFRKLNRFVTERNLGEVLYAPIAMLVDDYNAPQPDLLYVSVANKDAVGEFVIERAPELAVEILSPSTMYHDRHYKRKLYGRFGVKEYWLIDPQNKAVEVNELKSGGYELFSFAAEKGAARSQVLNGFEIDLKELFG